MIITNFPVAETFLDKVHVPAWVSGDVVLSVVRSKWHIHNEVQPGVGWGISYYKTHTLSSWQKYYALFCARNKWEARLTENMLKIVEKLSDLKLPVSQELNMGGTRGAKVMGKYGQKEEGGPLLIII